MIYAVASDPNCYTLISDGHLVGRATLGWLDEWVLKVGIGVALKRMYIIYPGRKYDFRPYKHYYLVDVNMAMTTELVARAYTDPDFKMTKTEYLSQKSHFEAELTEIKNKIE